MSEQADQPEAIGRRLVRLEEGQAFADRAVEQLGDEVRMLSRRLHEALERTRRLESMLSALLARQSSGEGAGEALDDEAGADDAPPSG